MMTMLWLLWFAHVTTDFLFGSYELPGTEPGTLHLKFLIHGLITFLCTLAVMHIYGWRAALVAGGLVTAGHILLDLLMTLGCAQWSRYQGTPKESGVAGLLVDQILHLWMLIWVWGLVEKPPSVEGVTFLFAAKSITRYKRISEERNFAEYYLIGTLLSIIWALAIGLGLKGILAKGFS